jgi:hypothetical protein
MKEKLKNLDLYKISYKIIAQLNLNPYFYRKKHHAPTHWNMAHKDFTLIPSQKTGFVHPAKLMRGDLLLGKISLGINFPLS